MYVGAFSYNLMAGEEGVEPSISCARNRRLTTWPLATITGQL